MKVVTVSTNVNGGAANACRRLHEQFLRTNEVESSFLTKKKFLADFGFNETLVDVKNKFLNWQHSPLRAGKNGVIWNAPYSCLDIRKHPLVQEADIVHLNWVEFFLDYRTFFKIDKPIVWTLHDMAPFSFGNHYETGYELKSHKARLNSYRKAKTKCFEGVENIHIVGLSKWLLSLSQNSGLFSDFQHSLIPNGIKTDQSADKRILDKLEGLRKEGHRLALIIAFSHADIRKGGDLLKIGIDLLLEKGYTPVIAGKYPDSSDLRIVRLGFLKKEAEIKAAYVGCDFSLILSREDNLPNTVLESICYGTPVLAFSVGGIPDMITDGENGVLSSNISKIGINELLEKYTRLTFEETKIGKQAKLKYDVSIMSKGYIELYKDLLNNYK